jgi:hypothetical protein
VGLFGKYLNSVANWTDPPPGFGAWLANGGGDYIAPSFGASGLGWYGIPDGMARFTASDYTTSVVGNASLAWVRRVATREPHAPFFAYVAPKAAHEPFIPPPWYLHTWRDDWPAAEPRPIASWNASREQRADKHGVVASNRAISAQVRFGWVGFELCV